ncbi:hypothetical protein FHS88_001768 [Roseomonas alkaliterrae]|uniref:Uncharacterized protein n=1 Tax=Neoroseomonas alkaliterrae TaxID=1452450 RepID=A0A840Y6D0_9PROT|nr:hypothetical protein [Neoroseomonas alkaliterrae]
MPGGRGSGPRPPPIGVAGSARASPIPQVAAMEPRARRPPPPRPQGHRRGNGHAPGTDYDTPKRGMRFRLEKRLELR